MTDYNLLTVTMQVDVSTKLARELLEMALESDWVEEVQSRRGGHFVSHKFKSRLDIPFAEECFLAISHRRLGSSDLVFTDLGLEQMRRGFQVLATQFPSSFKEVTQEDHIADPSEADLWLQCALWGEQRFES